MYYHVLWQSILRLQCGKGLWTNNKPKRKKNQVIAFNLFWRKKDDLSLMTITNYGIYR